MKIIVTLNDKTIKKIKTKLPLNASKKKIKNFLNLKYGKNNWNSYSAERTITNDHLKFTEELYICTYCGPNDSHTTSDCPNKTLDEV